MWPTPPLVNNLRHAAAAALKQAGRRLLVEPINTHDVPGFFVHHTAQAVALLDEVGADNAFVQYDIYHAQRMEGDLAATLQRHLARIRPRAVGRQPRPPRTRHGRDQLCLPAGAPGPHRLHRLGGLRIHPPPSPPRPAWAGASTCGHDRDPLAPRPTCCAACSTPPSRRPSLRCCVPAHLPAPAELGNGRLIVIGAGKASAAMARAVEDHWRGPASALSGLVVTRYGHAVPCQHIEIVEAAHPGARTPPACTPRSACCKPCRA